MHFDNIAISIGRLKKILYRYPLYHRCREFYYAYIFSLYYKIIFLRAVIKNGFKIRTILMYPELPKSKHVLFRITHMLGCHITNKPKPNLTAVIRYQDTTFKGNDSTLMNLSRKYKIINYNCSDISKENVDLVFEKVFGYSISINPLLKKGEFIKKSNINSSHDAIVITCPIDKAEKGYVYQKLINNQFIDETALDIRTSVYKDTIPFVYIKYRSVQNRFGGETIKDKIAEVKIAEVNEVFSQDEVEKIVLFCREMGLDCCELDILRNKDDGRIYIVDANDTPGNLPTYLLKEGRKVALQRLSATFEKTFLQLRGAEPR